jgi:hypothetical protein
MFNLLSTGGQNPPKRRRGENPPVVYTSVEFWKLCSKGILLLYALGTVCLYTITELKMIDKMFVRIVINCNILYSIQNICLSVSGGNFSYKHEKNTKTKEFRIGRNEGLLIAYACFYGIGIVVAHIYTSKMIKFRKIDGRQEHHTTFNTFLLFAYVLKNV